MLRFSPRWFLGTLALGLVLMIPVAFLGERDYQRKLQTETQRYGVEQVVGQEWQPFTAQEITIARTRLGEHPVDLGPGERQAVILRTVVSRRPGTYNCPGLGTCWAALIVLAGDRNPRKYHIVNTIGDNLGLMNRCFQAGDMIVLNWGAMQRQYGNYTGITDANWIRSLGPVRCPG